MPQIESRHARLLARMADHKVDRTEVFPKDAEGYVKCEKKSTCFVLQAEGCARAKLSHRTTTSAYGIRQVVNADYRIEGPESGRCKLIRHVTSTDMTLDPKLVATLHKQGKTDERIAAMRTDVTAKLRQQWPPQLECWFGSDDVLEATLDLSESRYNPQLWRESCHEIDAEAASGTAQEASAEGAPANPAAADEKADPGKAKADTPAAEPSPAAGKSVKTGTPSGPVMQNEAQGTAKNGAASAKAAPDKPAATNAQ